MIRVRQGLHGHTSFRSPKGQLLTVIINSIAVHPDGSATVAATIRSKDEVDEVWYVLNGGEPVEVYGPNAAPLMNLLSTGDWPPS